jgi:hypothetical protein
LATLLTRRVAWSEQPNGYSVELDPAKCAALGVCGGFVANGEGLAVTVDGQPLGKNILSGQLSSEPVLSTRGTAFGVGPAVGSNGFLLNTGSPNSRSFTVLARVRTAATGLFGRGGTTLPIWRNAGAFDMRINGSDYTGAGTWTASQWYDIEIVGSSTACQLYVDGVLTISGAAATAGAISAQMQFGADSSGGGGGAIAGQYYLWASRPLSAEDRRSIRDNPWLE